MKTDSDDSDRGNNSDVRADWLELGAEKVIIQTHTQPRAPTMVMTMSKIGEW